MKAMPMVPTMENAAKSFTWHRVFFLFFFLNDNLNIGKMCFYVYAKLRV